MLYIAYAARALLRAFYATAILLVVLASVIHAAHAQGNAPAPSEHLPYGAPTIPGTVEIDHKAYISFYDPARKIPRLVAYHLTGARTLGCFPRLNNFHVDPLFPTVAPSNYSGSGQDLGHQAPAQDFGWSAETMSDSFSTANMAPQVPALNRQGWEYLEASVRAWAWDHAAPGTAGHDFIVLTGPVLDPSDQHIGKAGVEVPKGFWKVIEDEASRTAVAFIYPNAPIAKGDLTPYRATLAEVETTAGFPLPIMVTQASVFSPFTTTPDLSGWERAHKAACPAR